MPSTISFKFGDIVLVPFPFTDQTASKRRPAVVVSSEAYHRERPDLILLAVTSQIRPSTIKPIFTTVEKELILRKLGQLIEEDRQALRQALPIILGQ